MEDAELIELRKQCITSLFMCTDNISKYLDNDEKEDEYNRLQSCVEGYCFLDAQQTVASQALEKVKRETDSTNIDTLENRFEAELRNMTEKRLNTKNHPYMIEFTKRVQKGRQLSRQNLDDSDLAVTESRDQFIDPITKRPIVDPVKNIICGHIYEKDAIISLIKVNQRTVCPVAGCGNRQHITQNHLKSDEELKFRMAITQHSTMIQERSALELDDTM